MELQDLDGKLWSGIPRDAARWGLGLALCAVLGCEAGQYDAGRRDYGVAPSEADRYDEGATPEHGTLTEQAAQDTEQALAEMDRYAFRSTMDDRLSGIERWASLVREQDQEGSVRMDDDTKRAIREIEGQVAMIREEMQSLDGLSEEASAAWARQAQALHERLVELEVRVTQVGAQRSAPPQSSLGGTR